MSCPIEKVTELLKKEGIDATPDMIKALALRAQVMNMIDVGNVAEFKNKKQLKEDRKKAKAETKNETKPEPLKIGDTKAEGYAVMKALWNKTKEINIASLNSPVVSIVKGPASSYSAKTNTLKLSEDSVKDNRTIAHELLHAVTGAMTYARLSDESKTSLKDVMAYMLDGISEDVVKYDETSKEDLGKISDVATAELAYLRKAAQGKLSDKMSAEEKFFREFVAIMGSSSGARAKLYGQYKSRESLKKVGMIDKLLRNIVEVAKYVKGILKEILAMDDAALKSNPKYIDMLAIIDDALQDVADDKKSINSTTAESAEVVEKALSNPLKGDWVKRATNTLQGTPVAEFGEQIGDNEVTEAEAKLLETDGLEVTLDQITSGGKPLVSKATTKPEDDTIVYTGKTSLSDLKSLQEGICK